MFKMPICHYCDNCQFQLEEEDREVPIYILKMPTNEMYFFCCRDCMKDFLRECTVEAYVYPNGTVEEEE